jgi:hypothetical protein
MSSNVNQHMNKIARVRKLYIAALVLACAFGTVTNAVAQKITSPTTPPLITPPAGNSAFLLGHGVGTQGYVCLPKGTGASWTVNNARPEATLFTSFFGQDIQIITHFLSPIQTPTRLPKTRYPSVAQRGRVPSIAARYGHRSCFRIRPLPLPPLRSPPAPTRVVRIPARLPASCCNRLVRNRDQRR